jgi:hypothetical protein
MAHVGNQRELMLSHTHEALMHHMLMYPTQTIREIAAVFGYTASYTSNLIHNDLFQARFKQLQQEHFHSLASPLNVKIEALAHQCIERWAEKIEASDDPEFIKTSADKLLQRLGYGASNKVQVNVGVPDATSATIVESREAIAAGTRARLRLRELSQTAEEVPYAAIEAK